jgi:competence protein ComEA
VLQPLRYREAARNADAARSRLSLLSSPIEATPVEDAGRFHADLADDDSVDPAPAAPAQPSSRGRTVPALLREARLVAPRQAVAGLLVVALISALATAALLWRVRPQAVAVGPPPVVGTFGPAAPKPAPSPSPRPLVLAVVGRVRHPGLVTVPAGARLIDALKAAGGQLPGVDITPLNLARKVADGEQIVVGVQGPVSAGPVAGSVDATPSTTVVNLNSATLADLDGLPGIGPVIASRILEFRSAHGGFAAIDQLRQVSGVGDRTFERLRGLVTV